MGVGPKDRQRRSPGPRREPEEPQGPPGLEEREEGEGGPDVGRHGGRRQPERLGYRYQEGPEEARVALDVLAGVEHKPLADRKVMRVAERDVGVDETDV